MLPEPTHKRSRDAAAGAETDDNEAPAAANESASVQQSSGAARGKGHRKRAKASAAPQPRQDTAVTSTPAAPVRTSGRVRYEHLQSRALCVSLAVKCDSVHILLDACCSVTLRHKRSMW